MIFTKLGTLKCLKMKNLILVLCVIFTVHFFDAQVIKSKNQPRKYVVEYDKISSGDFKYKEVVYKKGVESEKSIDQPKLRYGDIVIFRSFNTNEFVFDMEIEESSVSSQEKSGLAQVIGGFSGLLSGAGGKLSSLTSLLGDHMGYSQPNAISIRDISIENKSEKMSRAEQLKFEYASSKFSLSNSFKEIQKGVESLEQGINVLTSESMTKNEIQLAFNQFSKNFDMYKLLKNLEEAESTLDELGDDLDEFRVTAFWDEENEKELLNMKHSFEMIQSFFEDQELGPFHLEDMERALAQMDFVIEKKILIEDEAETSGQSYKEFMIKFTDKNDYSTKMTRLERFPVVGAHLPTWTTGIVFLSPFSGIDEYTIQENSSYDSVLVSSSQNRGLKMSVGTSLVYEFLTTKIIVPNVNAGVAIGIDPDDSRFNITLGGGLRFRDFNLLSINAGISFTRVQRLNSNYVTGSWIANDEIPVNDNYEPDLFEGAFSPGYYFGLNIHF